MKVSYYTKLAGVSFRQDVVAKLEPKKTMLRAVAEPENQYDSKAVRIEALTADGWEHVGYIAKGKNEAIQKELLEGREVKITLDEVTGLDKKTLGVNIGVEYGDDSGIDPADMRDFTITKAYKTGDLVYFDEIHHKAYDGDGNELLSGSIAEGMLAPKVDLTYPAKALSKSTGVLQEDIMSLWENNAELAASHGTLVHRALELYFTTKDKMVKIDENKEREHTASNWMPEYLGAIVDKFIKASGIVGSPLMEQRIKHDKFTGIVDCLVETPSGFIINDFKVTKKIKEVDYKGIGKKTKYTVQQNLYRQIIEESTGLKCQGMFLWQWDGKTWTEHELDKIDVMEMF